MNTKNDRKVSIDIETTGMSSSKKIYQDHKIIEIGAVEIINRKLTGKYFHTYINPGRSITKEAFHIHGISNDFLIKKPSFKEIYTDFINFIKFSEIIVHNANFDIEFLDFEIKSLNIKDIKISNLCKITDTLTMARKFFPGKKNNLDALCNRYNISINKRILHSAIVDAKLLSKLYIRMTSLQTELKLNLLDQYNIEKILKKKNGHKNLFILKASNFDTLKHFEYLKNMEKKGCCIWTNKK